LMDIVLHPRFAENKWVYISYHKPVPTGRTLGNGQPELAGASTLARGVWDGKAITNLTDIFETGATVTESSRIAFGRDGMLYMTVSAPGTGPQVVRSQDPSDYAGKVIRLRDDGSIPPDNPFVGRAGFKPAIYTLGHRNGHSLVVNPETGDLWMTEQGPNGGDEINILKAGRDYGWPTVSYGRNYLGPPISEVPWRADFDDVRAGLGNGDREPPLWVGHRRAGEALARAKQLNLCAADSAAGWIAHDAVEHERRLG